MNGWGSLTKFRNRYGKTSKEEPKRTKKPSWQWSVIPSPSGSYPILWQNVQGDKPVLYVQLDGGVGTVRMSSESKTEMKEKRETIWDKLYEKLKETDGRIPVTRGENSEEKDFRYGSGKTCKVFEFRYLIREEDGYSYIIKDKNTDKELNEGRSILKPFTIDISKTVERILEVSKVLPEVEKEVFNSEYQLNNRLPVFYQKLGSTSLHK